jgi:preprotein translocase subunit SecG
VSNVNEVRALQRMRNRTTVVLLALFVLIIFALSFSHALKEQAQPKKTTFVQETAMETLFLG